MGLQAAAMTRTMAGGRYRDALRVAEFRALAGSSLVSVLGDSLAYLAVTVLVYQRTASPLLAALTFAVAFVPYLFGGTLLSALVDRIAPRRMLIGCDLVSGALVAVIALPGTPLALVFAALFAVGTLAPVRSGTAGAIVAQILPGERFVPGRSVLRIVVQTAQIVGAAAGGALLVPFGAHGALLADTLSFGLSAALVGAGLACRPVNAAAPPRSLVSDSLAGLRAVWALADVRRLLSLQWLVSFVAVAPEGLAAPAVAQSGHTAAYVGLWLTAIPAGTVLGDLLTVWTVPARMRPRLTWPLALLLPALLLGFAIRPPLPAAITLLALSGAASAYGLGLDQTLRDSTPQPLLARMYTVNQTGLMVVQGLGFAAAGALGGAVSAGTAITVAGSVGVLGVTVLWRQPATIKERQSRRARRK
jgi:MFS family permease